MMTCNNKHDRPNEKNDKANEKNAYEPLKTRWVNIIYVLSAMKPATTSEQTTNVERNDDQR
jgi:hypothetical protein